MDDDIDYSAGKQVKCDRYMTFSKNNESMFYQGFEGIPLNLMINVIAWLILILLFVILRKRAWDYGRIAVVATNEERIPIAYHPDTGYNVWTALFFGDRQEDEGTGSAESVKSASSERQKEGWKWIPTFFKLKDVDILKKSGPDAIQYQTFQRYLIIYALVIGVLSVSVILPLNLHGSLKSPEYQKFGTTTISNIDKDSPFLWAHFVFGVAYFILAVLTMWHFSSSLKFERRERASKTLMVSGIPLDSCLPNLLLDHFSEAYPTLHVLDIQFAHDIRQLNYLCEMRDLSLEALRQSERVLEQTGTRPTLVAATCGQCCCCCKPCGCRPVDAIDFYQSETEKWSDRIEVEKPKTYASKVGVAFVTFSSAVDATRVRDDYRSSCKSPTSPGRSAGGPEINSEKWTVCYAPSPDDIKWENIVLRPSLWWVKAVIVNMFVFLLAFFFTTPTYVLNLLNKLEVTSKLETASSFSPVLIQFVPSLILWLASALLPFAIYYSDQLVGHWTKTSEHVSIMVKSFVFLVFMVLVLPSLGLTSIPALLNWIFPRHNSSLVPSGKIDIVQWECVFMEDNGAFFVNYVITASFIGSALELIRIPELLTYAIRILAVRSPMEKTAVRKKLLWEFQFGLSYAWMLCIFTVIICYSLLCPMMMPFGILYLVFKYGVDRYNLYYAYTPSRINKRIHRLATNCMIGSVLLMQFFILGFLLLRFNLKHPLSISAITALLICTIGALIRAVSGLGAGVPSSWKPIDQEANDDAGGDDSRRRASTGAFVPPVLQGSSNTSHVELEEEEPRPHAGLYGARGETEVEQT